jgi:hypothetical protein
MSAPTGNGVGAGVLSCVDMLLALLLQFISPELLLCLSLWRFSLSALEEMGKAGPFPTKKMLSKVQQSEVQTKAFETLLSRLPLLTNYQLTRMLIQFTQYTQLGDDWQLSGKFPNSGVDEKWHTLHYSQTVHVVEAIVAVLTTRGAKISKRLLKKLDGSCLTFRKGSLRFGSGRTLKNEIEATLKTNNKSVDALTKMLSNPSLNVDIRIVKQKELDAILADPDYLRTKAYYEEMLQQCCEIEATAQEGDTFEAFFLGREMCDTVSALTPLKGRLVVSHLDGSLDVPMGMTKDERSDYLARECERDINAILQSQGIEPTYAFCPIKLVGDTRSKSLRKLSSSPSEGVIHYWDVEVEENTYHARLKEKYDEMNHEPGNVSCVFTPGSPFTKEVYHTAMDVMLRERKAQRDLEAQHKLEAYHAHKNLFSNVLGEIAKHSVQ